LEHDSLELDTATKKRLQRRALQVRLASIKWIKQSAYGFLGSCLSLAEILAVISEYFLLSPEARNGDARDYIILSKGHAAPALYAALAMTSKLPDGEYARLGSPFQGHPNSTFNPLIDVTTGSLGNGLAVGVGVAHGLRLQGKQGRVVVIMGDGELQEGLVWEAYIHAVAMQLQGLLLIIDENGFQSNGAVPTNHITRAMFQSTCSDFTVVNGHDLSALAHAIRHFTYTSTMKLIIAQTHRGQGIPALVSNPTPMSWIPDERVLDEAIATIENQLLTLEEA
jgi:transketolase